MIWHLAGYAILTLAESWSLGDDLGFWRRLAVTETFPKGRRAAFF